MKQELENPMRKISIEKVVLSCGATGPDLEKAKKLLAILTERKIQTITSAKRIPDFNVRPGLEVGVRVTLRGEQGIKLLKTLLGALDGNLKTRSISDNHFSFGIAEYIDIPGVAYQREIGIRGLNITVDFIRAGVRVKRKKIRSGKLPKKQHISKEEIIKFMESEFQTKFI